MRALIDTNVFLDVFLTREPHYRDSSHVVSAAESQTFEAYCCATTITDIYYIVQKVTSESIARRAIAGILRTCELAPVGRSTVTAALNSEVADVEDGILCEVALLVDASCIVTRNIADFANSQIKAVTPSDFLLLLDQEV